MHDTEKSQLQSLDGICLIPFPKYVFGLWSIFWRQVTILYHAILVSYIIFLWIECVVALYYTITITYYVAILLYDETTTRTTCVCVCLAVIIKGLSFIFSEIEFTQYTKAQSTKLHSYWNCYKMKLLFRYFDIKQTARSSNVWYLISIFSIYQVIHAINRTAFTQMVNKRSCQGWIK